MFVIRRKWEGLERDVEQLRESVKESEDTVGVLECWRGEEECGRERMRGERGTVPWGYCRGYGSLRKFGD